MLWLSFPDCESSCAVDGLPPWRSRTEPCLKLLGSTGDEVHEAMHSAGVVVGLRTLRVRFVFVVFVSLHEGAGPGGSVQAFWASRIGVHKSDLEEKRPWQSHVKAYGDLAGHVGGAAACAVGSYLGWTQKADVE